jgi:drug/metabolite transporter (DMT)-like permease
MKRRQLIIGYAFVAIGAALFSSKAIFIKLAYMEKADAALMLALRMAFALPFFVAVGLLAWRARRATGVPPPGFALILRALLSGFIGYYLAMILDFEGLIFISAQLERLVLFTYPVFVMLLGAAFFGSRLSWQGLGAAGVTYLGLAAVFAADLSEYGSDVITGALLVLGSALAFAVYQLLAKDIIAAVGSTLFTSLALSAAAVAGLGHYAVVNGGFGFTASRSFVLLAAATGIFATVLPSFLVNAGLARIGPQSTAMMSILSPLLTIYFAVLLLGEPFTLFDGIGTAFVLGGIGFYTWHELRSPAA